MEETITPELVRNYRNSIRTDWKTISGGKIFFREHSQPRSLCELVHGQCGGYAMYMAWGKEDCQELLESKVKLTCNDYELIQAIGSNFIKAHQKVELTDQQLAEKTDFVAKSCLVQDFAAFYNLFEPSNEIARYVRELIEEVFTVLELGPIPPSKFMNRLAIESESRQPGASAGV